MKKLILIITTLVVISFSVSAEYVCAPGAESLYDLASPFGLSYGGSVVGGGITYISPTSIIVNPALTAREQRIGINVGYTALIAAGNYSAFGSAFQTGIMIPFNWAVVTGYVNGTFPGDTLFTSNTFTVKASVAKEITSHLSVGVGATSGFAFGDVGSWALSGDVGFVYSIPELAFMKDFRFGASILNAGKNYSFYKGAGLLDCYPGFTMMKAGVGAILVSNDTIQLGVSVDTTTPLFRNLILDTGCQLTIKNMLTISVSEKINFWELSHDVKSFIPTVGVFFRFGFNVKNNDYLKSHDWSESEMTAGIAYRNFDNGATTVHAISAGADLLLGQKDDKAPEIKVWDDED